MTGRGLTPEIVQLLVRAMQSASPTHGLMAEGNINLFDQPIVRNPDGTTSTVDSSSYNLDGLETLLPSVTPDGRHLRTAEEIVAEFRKTGRHLGQFANPQAATDYARRLHEAYARGDYSRGQRSRNAVLPPSRRRSATGL